MLPFLILVLIFPSVAVPQSIIKTLPGFPGELPFMLETGYIGVGDLNEVQLFYYFCESERSPKDDPLVLWLTGGPGCSEFGSDNYIFLHAGPFTFNYENIGKPSLRLNPYSWTKIANIIFLDAPVGTGFSYATTSEGYTIGDLSSAAQTYEFLKKWLKVHSKFLDNPLYVAGDSYAGMQVPIIVQEISNGLDSGHHPPMNIKGFFLGNPFTDVKCDLNSRVIFAHLKGLISDELYESAKKNCDGEYMHPYSSNVSCIDDLQSIDYCPDKLQTSNILEQKCRLLSPKPNVSDWLQRSELTEDFIDVLLSKSQIPEPYCRDYNYLLSYTWANDKNVQNALNVREGTITGWERCNSSFSSTHIHDLVSSIDYQRKLTEGAYYALIYSGDHNMVIPYVGTHEWIESLNLTVSNDWQAWFVDGQVAGYVTTYSKGKYSLTYATVKGAGHTAPEYKPKQCLAMLDRWLAYYYI